MNWQPLPDGDAIALAPGASYAIVASLKVSHTAADVQALAVARGLSLVDYAEEGQRAGLGPDPRAPDYRMVAAIATASAPGELPWSVPWPLSLVDGSGIVRAWVSPTGQAVPPAPAAAPGVPTAAAPPIWPVAVGLVAAGAGGWWLSQGRRRR